MTEVEFGEIPAIRDHEQNPLREAAMWVVLNWDAQRSLHGTMGRLRMILGLPSEPPTQEEAEARIAAYIGADRNS